MSSGKLISKSRRLQLETEIAELQRRHGDLLCQLSPTAGDVDQIIDAVNLREELQLLSAQIADKQRELSSSVTYTPDNQDEGVVTIGSIVVVQEIDLNAPMSFEPETYEIVCNGDTPVGNHASYSSPLGTAVMGQKAGTKVIVQAPVPYVVEILEVTNPPAPEAD